MSDAIITRLKSVKPPLRWTPTQGDATREFQERKLKQDDAPGKEELDAVIYEAQQILGRCIYPLDTPTQETGLVVGYVQSGKTLSFTAVIALAKDNGFGLVILLAGTQNHLKGQSEERLRVDLGIEGGTFGWREYPNPTCAKDLNAIKNNVRSWKTNASVRRKPILITILKQHSRLNELAKLLKELDLAGVPTLVVDDEGDQASPNTKASKNRLQGTDDRSTTYDRIVKLKDIIPHHTYLQYTATPQANLLIGIADVLSPSFAELVSPGEAYIGGKDFFGSGSSLCVDIPLGDIPTANAPLNQPPDSLLRALRFFLLGASAHLVAGKPGNRSMMVHPSQLTIPHADYQVWMQNLVSAWLHFLGLPETSSARLELVGSFAPEYESLYKSTTGLPPLNILVSEMTEVLSDIRVVKVNGKADAEKNVRWQTWPYWILVGGQKLDRGFTVKGLTVTYMPRPASQNADTLQQRARFFGYKKGYQGLCRVFLPTDVREIYASYVESEEFVRSALEKHRGKPLAEWKRDFILDRAMSPTRTSVVGRQTRRILSDGDWWAPEAMYKSPEAAVHNRMLLRQTAARWMTNNGRVDAADFPQYKDIRKSKHNWLVESVSAEEIQDFLLGLQIRDFKDSIELGAVMVAMALYIEATHNPTVDVFILSELEWEFPGTSGRALTNGRIANIFAGRQPDQETDISKLNYVGDRALRASSRPTLHLRLLKLKEETVPAGELCQEIPWVAVHMTEPYAKDCIIEEL
jgi:hypothetical protein